VYLNESVTVRGVPANRYRASSALLDQTAENQAMGAGVPYAGVQNLAYILGAPTYVSRPLFMFGDPALLTQSSNADKFMVAPRAAGFEGGIKLYSAYDYKMPHELLDTPRLIDPDFLDENIDYYDTFLDIEPASGKTISAHKRLMASPSVWSCDPARQSSCGLFPAYPIVADKSGDCYTAYTASSGQKPYPCSAANILTPRVMADKAIPAFWMDQTATLTQDQADKVATLGQVNQAAGVFVVVVPILVVLSAGFWWKMRTKFGCCK